jgi:hypothetical protein
MDKKDLHQFFGVAKEYHAEFDLFFPLWQDLDPWWTPSKDTFNTVRHAFTGWRLARFSAPPKLYENQKQAIAAVEFSGAQDMCRALKVIDATIAAVTPKAP